MAKSNQSKSTKPAAKAEQPVVEAAPAKKDTKSAPKPAVATKSVAAAKAPAVKGKKVAAKPATTSGTPVIDTNLAAQNAAKMLVNRNMLQGRAGAEKPNSAGFRQMKEGLTKAVSPASIPFLPGSGTQKKNAQDFGVRSQVGHNQTFGADVNRTGVPRRTGGG